MSGNTKKITWQVEAWVEGQPWPVSVETDIPIGSICEMNEALENTALWFLRNNFHPQRFSAPSLAPQLPDKKPMPEKDAIPTLPLHPVCPHCKSKMTISKHQEKADEVQYYCPTRFGNGDYCRWRAGVEPVTGEYNTWEIKKKNGGK